MQNQSTGGSINNPFGTPQQTPKANPFNIKPQITGDRPAARNGINTIDPFASISSSRNSTVTQQPTSFLPQQQSASNISAPFNNFSAQPPLNTVSSGLGSAFSSTPQVGFNLTGNSIKSSANSAFINSDLLALDPLSSGSGGYTQQQQYGGGGGVGFNQTGGSVGYNTTGGSGSSGVGFNQTGGSVGFSSSTVFTGGSSIGGSGGFASNASSTTAAKNPFASIGPGGQQYAWDSKQQQQPTLSQLQNTGGQMQAGSGAQQLNQQQYQNTQSFF